MSSQRFSGAQREAIWLAHGQKCAYTREPIDLGEYQIDHILPESLLEEPERLAMLKSELGLSSDFDLRGYANLLPSKVRTNNQKSNLVFDKARTHFFLGIAAEKVDKIYAYVKEIERKATKGRALILLQQCLERGELSAEDVSNLLERHADAPEQIFQLLQSLHFVGAEDVRIVAHSDLEELRDRPVRLGENDHIDGVTLTNAAGEERLVRTCREYDHATADGFSPYTNFDIKMSAWFEHQCGLLSALRSARIPTTSHLANPRIGILDLDRMPYSLFPEIGEPRAQSGATLTYQGKVDDGTLVLKGIGQNWFQIEEPDGMGQQLVEVARADFNGDGLEDILLFEYCFATHGTLGFGGIRILTLTSPNGMLEDVTASCTCLRCGRSSPDAHSTHGPTSG